MFTSSSQCLLRVVNFTYGQDAITLLSNPNTAACNEPCNGSITIRIDESKISGKWNYPLEIEWVNNTTGNSGSLLMMGNFKIINGLCKGLYTVTIHLNQNCEFEGSIEVEEILENLTLIADVTPESALNCKDGCVDLSIFNFASPVNIKWFQNGIEIVSLINITPNSGAEDLCDIVSGMYSVLVSDECSTVELTVNVPINDSQIFILSLVNSSICEVEESGEPCDGSIVISFNSASSYNIKWSNGSTSSSIHGLCPGNYIVTITNSSGCEFIKSFNICCCIGSSESACLSGNGPITVDDVDLQMPHEDVCDGSISLDMQGGISPLHFLWNGPNGFSSSNMNISGLCPGEYCVKIFDGCSEIEQCFSIESCIKQEFENIFSLEGVTSACPNVADGKIILIANPGYTISNINWNFTSGTSSTLEDLGPGEYCLTASVNNSCDVELCVIVEEEECLYVENSTTETFEVETTEGVVQLDILTCITECHCKGKIVSTTSYESNRTILRKPNACAMRQSCPDGSVSYSPWANVVFSPQTKGIDWDMDILPSGPLCVLFTDCPFDEVGLSATDTENAICLGVLQDGFGGCIGQFECCFTVGWIFWPFIREQVCENFSIPIDCGFECTPGVIGGGEIPNRLVSFNMQGSSQKSFILSGRSSSKQESFIHVYNESLESITKHIFPGDNEFNFVTDDDEKVHKVFGYVSSDVLDALASQDIWVGGKDGYLIKYDDDLQVEEIFYFGGENDQEIKGSISLTTQEITVGTYERELIVNNQALFTNSDETKRMFLLNHDGDEIFWSLEGSENSAAEGIEKLNEDFLVWGTFQNNFSIGGKTIFGENGFFVFKLTSSGDVEWIKALESNELRVEYFNEDLLLIVEGNHNSFKYDSNEFFANDNFITALRVNVNDGSLMNTDVLIEHSGQISLCDTYASENDLYLCGSLENSSFDGSSSYDIFALSYVTEDLWFEGGENFDEANTIYFKYPHPYIGGHYYNSTTISGDDLSGTNEFANSFLKRLTPINSQRSKVKLDNLKDVNRRSQAISLFPNPTNGKLKAEIYLAPKSMGTIEIYNYLSQRIFSSDFTTNHSGFYFSDLSLESLNKGVYFFAIKTQDGLLFNTKFIKLDNDDF